MSARILPFPALEAAGVDKLIARARLPESAKLIARAYLHIAVAGGVAANSRIRRDILPELERVANL